MADLDEDTIRVLKFISSKAVVMGPEIAAKCFRGSKNKLVIGPYMSALARRGYIVARGSSGSYYVATPEGDAFLDALAKSQREEKKPGVPSCELF